VKTSRFSRELLGWCRREKIAEQVPGKSAAEVRDHYEELVHEILEIESGRVDVPNYPNDLVVSGGSGSSDSDSSNKTRHADKEKKKMKKGRSWTEDEHVYVKKITSIYSCTLRFYFYI
jgi:hypothetical protein